MREHPHILVVDDEKAIADLVAKLLEAEGMDVRACSSGEHALVLFESQSFDLAILDIMMPGIDGFEVCQRIRAVSEVPVIFLSAKDEEIDKVVGLTLGADDYVAKPFRSRELVARVKARLRRSKGGGTDTAGIVRMQGIELDLNVHTASLHGEPLKLTPKEYDTLAVLVKAGGSPVPAQRIFESVWHEPFDEAAGNTIMVHIRNLRKKLAAVDSSQKFIETAWGVGYKIASSDVDAKGGA